SVQARLLRVLEEEAFLRLGGTKPIKVHFRMVTAANTNLKEVVTQGRVREDLFYQLHVVPPVIPPPRENMEDNLPFGLDMVQGFNGRDSMKELKKNFLRFTPEAADLIVGYAWPGNIRELEKCGRAHHDHRPEGNIDSISLPEEIRESRNHIHPEIH